MAFFWEGNTGGRVTPAMATRKRNIAGDLLGESRTKANNWGEGLARVAQALSGTVLEGQAAEMSQAGADEVAALLAGLSPESGFGDISAALANPWLAESPGGSAIAQALLVENMRRSDPMYGLSLDSARMGNERAAMELDALRNPAAPFQPRTLTPEEMAQWGLEGATGSWVTTEGGAPQQLYAPPDPTAGMQNFDFLTGQGFDPMDAASRAFSGGVTVNNLPQVGTPPAGFQNVFDDQGRLLRQDMIEGGPAWLEAQQAEDAAGRQQALTGRQILPTIDDIATARSLADQPGTLGSLAPALSGVPILGQTAQDMAATIDAIGSGISLENLNQMRQASPTGGALGNVSDKQSALLSEAFGSLRQSMSRELFLYNLARVENTLNDIVHGEAGGPPRNDMTELRNTLLGGQPPREAEVGAQSQQYPNAPSIGEVVEGYTYRGGNPADMSSWERVR